HQVGPAHERAHHRGVRGERAEEEQALAKAAPESGIAPEPADAESLGMIFDRIAPAGRARQRLPGLVVDVAGEQFHLVTRFRPGERELIVAARSRLLGKIEVLCERENPHACLFPSANPERSASRSMPKLTPRCPAAPKQAQRAPVAVPVLSSRSI